MLSICTHPAVLQAGILTVVYPVHFLRIAAVWSMLFAIPLGVYFYAVVHRASDAHLLFSHPIHAVFIVQLFMLFVLRAAESQPLPDWWLRFFIAQTAIAWILHRKISLHVFAWASLMAFAWYYNYRILGIVLFLATAGVAWVRLFLKAHTPRELFLGFATGLLTGWSYQIILRLDL